MLPPISAMLSQETKGGSGEAGAARQCVRKSRVALSNPYKVAHWCLPTIPIDSGSGIRSSPGSMHPTERLAHHSVGVGDRARLPATEQIARPNRDAYDVIAQSSVNMRILP